MSDLSVSANTSSLQQAGQSQWAQRKNEFQALGSALQSGDLAAAKKAYAALQQNSPRPGADRDGDNDGSGSASSSAASSSPSQNPFAALGQALSSGDLTGAQQAFSQLQQTRGHHHHHHQGSPSSTSTDTTPTTGATATTAVTDTSGSKLNLTA